MPAYLQQSLTKKGGSLNNGDRPKRPAVDHSDNQGGRKGQFGCLLDRSAASAGMALSYTSQTKKKTENRVLR